MSRIASSRLLSKSLLTLALTLMLPPTALPAQGNSPAPAASQPTDATRSWADFYASARQRTAAIQATAKVKLDLPYGPDPRQRLDVYLPAKATGRSPVLIFLHGGSFVEGDKSLYGFIAGPFIARNAVVIVPSYRLASGGFAYPAASDDMRAIVTWAYHHAAEFGGRPDALYLSGHSAGALMVAQAGADRSWMKREGVPASALRGVIAISEGYNLVQSRRYPPYAPSLQQRYAASPVYHVSNPAPQFLLAAGGAEKEEVFLAPSRIFAEVLTANGANARTLFEAGADHKQVVELFADTNSSLFQGTIHLLEGER